MPQRSPPAGCPPTAIAHNIGITRLSAPTSMDEVFGKSTAGTTSASAASAPSRVPLSGSMISWSRKSTSRGFKLPTISPMRCWRCSAAEGTSRSRSTTRCSGRIAGRPGPAAGGATSALRSSESGAALGHEPGGAARNEYAEDRRDARGANDDTAKDPRLWTGRRQSADSSAR